MKIIIGSRGSELALYQANLIKSYLEKLEAEAEIKIIKTTGDKIDYLSFDKIEGKGFFTKELEDALLSKEIDLAVHSLKDLSTQFPHGLKIGAYCNPEDSSELLLLNPNKYEPGKKLYLKEGAVIGTSSVRRQAQIAYCRPDLIVQPLRGNVPTRIKKLKENKYDAILIARAGVERLKLDISGLKSIVLDRFEFIPAPGQGILAIETRDNDPDIANIIVRLNDSEAQQKAELERGLLARFQGGCQLPLAVTSEHKGDRFYLKAFLGTRTENDWTSPRLFEGEGDSISGLIEKAYQVMSSSSVCKVLITRSEREGSGDLEILNGKAEIIYFPVFEVIPQYDEDMVKRIFDQIGIFHWIVFTSKNSVRIFDEIAKKFNMHLPPDTRIAAVGAKTAELLESLGFQVSLIPYKEDSSGLLNEFERQYKNNKLSILLPQGEEAPDTLEIGFESFGCKVARINIYRTVPSAPESLPKIISEEIDFFIFTSPLSVEYYKKLGHDLPSKAWVGAIGNPTAEALEKHFRKADYLPQKADIKDIAEKIRERL